MDVVRQILFAVEAIPPGEYSSHQPEIPDLDPASYSEYVQLLVEAGLVEAEVLDGGYVLIHRLTWAGHEFLDAARSDSLWMKFKAKLGGEFTSIPFGVASKLLSEFAVATARSALHLPPV